MAFFLSCKFLEKKIQTNSAYNELPPFIMEKHVNAVS